eukprot:7349724-Pyramimonas_sp.AAC.1
MSGFPSSMTPPRSSSSSSSSSRSLIFSSGSTIVVLSRPVPRPLGKVADVYRGDERPCPIGAP